MILHLTEAWGRKSRNIQNKLKKINKSFIENSLVFSHAVSLYCSLFFRTMNYQVSFPRTKDLFGGHDYCFIVWSQHTFDTCPSTHVWVENSQCAAEQVNPHGFATYATVTFLNMHLRLVGPGEGETASESEGTFRRHLHAVHRPHQQGSHFHRWLSVEQSDVWYSSKESDSLSIALSMTVPNGQKLKLEMDPPPWRQPSPLYSVQ